MLKNLKSLKILSNNNVVNKIKYILILFTTLLTFWIGFIHWTNVHQVAIKRNIFTGEMSIDTIPGINISAPWVQVSRIDVRPVRVCVDCSCRNINCRLVTFKHEYWKDFVDKEGFRYYWWANRFSINIGNREEYRGMKNILRGYSFDDEQNFLEKKQIIN